MLIPHRLAAASGKHSASADNVCNTGSNRMLILSVLGIIIVLGILLRSYDLSKQSLWLDEASSSYIAQSLTRAVTAEKTNPPLYYILLHFWIAFFGNSEVALRSLSVLPSVASIVLIYLLGAKLYDEKTGLIAAAFMAFYISYLPRSRSQMLRVGVGITLGIYARYGNCTR